MKRILAVCTLSLLFFGHTPWASAQSLGNAGTIQGTVVDSSGASVPNAAVAIHNSVTGHSQSTTSAPDGSFRLNNIPPNPYHLEVKAPGFDACAQDIDIRDAVPLALNHA
ncbi:MAG TPA: carboxypeptidase-like regulatory domain-containing protein [Bryobacteraceae bacterium]